MKKFLHRLFIIFLFVYALFIGVHIMEITWNPHIIILFSCGILLAILAHAKKNYITIVILILHMAIEWFEWSQEKLLFQQIVFNFIHAIMDFIFLSHELKIHATRFRKIFLVTVPAILIIIFLFGHHIAVEVQNLKNLEPFVIGGVLGCILSHIYFHLKKE